MDIFSGFMSAALKTQWKISEESCVQLNIR